MQKNSCNILCFHEDWNNRKTRAPKKWRTKSLVQDAGANYKTTTDPEQRRSKERNDLPPDPWLSHTTTHACHCAEKVRFCECFLSWSSLKLYLIEALWFGFPLLIYSSYQRNQRERNRVKTVNGGYECLRLHVPSAARSKKMSKVNNGACIQWDMTNIYLYL